MDNANLIEKAAAVIAAAGPRGTLIFTGAGISVESGIPPFRGQNGLWTQVDPAFIEIDNFYSNPSFCWSGIKRIFYDHWGTAKPNPAHHAVAAMQKHGWVNTLVTQNIDTLHQKAGAHDVVEFHGTLERLVCTECEYSTAPTPDLLHPEIPVCQKCGAMLKPDFVFFGEGIPAAASDAAFTAAQEVKTVLVVGTTGEVMPACRVPYEAKRHGACVIEINLTPSAFTRDHVTDLFLSGKAGHLLPQLLAAVEKQL